MQRAAAFLSILLAASLAQADSGQLMSWQIALEKAGFSPGLIDGRPGSKTALATVEFQQAHGFSPTGQLDPATLAALHLPDPTASYTIVEADLVFVTGPTPRSWVAKSKLPYLGYATLADLLAERFHTTRDALTRLNPGRSLASLQVGDTLVVPNVQPPELPAIHRVQVNLAQKTIRGYDAKGRLVALFHCSIAAHAEKRPSGQARVVTVSTCPTYRFDPRMWPEVKTVHEKLMIPPGPRNPVGLCWIGLSLPGYGMHGTPNPELIGKTGSHGCFRLTNWDAVRLGKMVRPGVPIVFVASERPSRLADAPLPLD